MNEKQVDKILEGINALTGVSQKAWESLVEYHTIAATLNFWMLLLVCLPVLITILVFSVRSVHRVHKSKAKNPKEYYSDSDSYDKSMIVFLGSIGCVILFLITFAFVVTIPEAYADMKVPQRRAIQDIISTINN
jgi:hypothetical protein